jgi:hypothetical protein
MTEFVMSGIAAFICELISSDVELAFVSVVWTWSLVCTGIFGLIPQYQYYTCFTSIFRYRTK